MLFYQWDKRQVQRRQIAQISKSRSRELLLSLSSKLLALSPRGVTGETFSLLYGPHRWPPQQASGLFPASCCCVTSQCLSLY